MTANNSDNPVVGVKEKVRAFVLEYAAGKGLTEVKDDEPLLTTNIIDSLGSFRMIAFLEQSVVNRSTLLRHAQSRTVDGLIRRRSSFDVCLKTRSHSVEAPSNSRNSLSRLILNRCFRKAARLFAKPTEGEAPDTSTTSG